MKGKINIFYQAIILFIAVFSLVSHEHVLLVSSLIGILLLMLMDKLGKGIVLREATALLYAFICLLMPLIGYNFYNSNDTLSRIWVKYMPVSENIYFGYALPAIAFFSLAITWPLSFREEADAGVQLQLLVQRIKNALKKEKRAGIILITIGVAVSLIINRLPTGVQFFATICFFASFSGLLYIYFSPNFLFKKWIVLFFILFIVLNAINGGMFTIVAYMGITIFSFFYIGKKTSLFKKIFFLLFAGAFFIVLQNTKKTYRSYTWRSHYYEGNHFLLFNKLFLDNLKKGDALIEKDAFFPVYIRANQGYNIALVMRRMPAIVPYDEGENLLIGFASALVPRVLWPNKPEAGGKANMKYYAGVQIRGWSTNVGPLGEAYGSFGTKGGIVFMFFLGLFIRFFYKILFKFTRKTPVLLCWLPVLFFQTTYSGETDTLQIFNSLIKTAFFIWLIFKLFPKLFPKEKNQYVKKNTDFSERVNFSI